MLLRFVVSIVTVKCGNLLQGILKIFNIFSVAILETVAVLIRNSFNLIFSFACKTLITIELHFFLLPVGHKCQ